MRSGDSDAFDWAGKIEAVAKIIKSERNVKKLLWEICGVVLELFSCDRAWLLFPCDPGAPVWEVPVERTVAAYPGANIQDLSVAMSPDVAQIFQTALDSNEPVRYGPGGLPLAENTKGFLVKSQLSMAIYPRVGKPWQFGIHQCSYERVWSDAEVRLFHIIGIMTAEALGNNLLFDDLQRINLKLEELVEQRTVELTAEKMFAESLIDTAQTIVLVLDRECRILRMNPYMEELSGYSLAEVQNRDWLTTFVPRKERSVVGALFHATVQSAQTTRHVNPIVLKNGSERQIEWRNKTLTDSDGNPLGVLAIGQDITRRLLVERELEQAKDAAERANSAKTRFLAAASHDLRQPMHALSLMIAALSARDLEPVSKQIVSDMKSALQVTGQLLNALLDISKLESNAFVPDRRMFNAAEFLDNLRKQFAVEAKELGVAIRIFPSRAILHTDIDLLGRIVQNFLSNAIHHGCGQKILVGCRRSGKNWRIEVWDRGQGIDQEHLEKIFEEFFQLNNPARNINKGLGLGLAISKRIAALLQLEVKVRSRPGRGSMFAVEVPAGELIERLPAESRIDEPDGRLQGKAVLVVDDDSRVLKAANYLLDSWGMRPTCVSNVEQTLALLSRADHRFDIVLLDFCLQDGWNGLQLYSEICRRLGNRIPALLLTGDLSVGRLREVQESGMSILYKPIDTAELYRLMREVIAD